MFPRFISARSLVSRLSKNRYFSVYSGDSVVPDTSRLPAFDLDKVDCTEPVIRSSQSNGILRITGLEEARCGELLNVHSSVPGSGRVQAVVLRLLEREVHAALQSDSHHVNIGDRVTVPGTVAMFPATPLLLGRSLNASGKFLDKKGPVSVTKYMPLTSVYMNATTPPLPYRAVEGDWLPTGITHQDMFHPVRQGLKIALHGDSLAAQEVLCLKIQDSISGHNGALQSARPFSSKMLDKVVKAGRGTQTSFPPVHPITSAADALSVGWTSNKNVFVYVMLGKTPHEVQRLTSQLHEHGLLPFSTLIIENGSAALQHQAVLAGVSLACYYRHLGLDCTFVLNDCTAHYEALNSLYHYNSPPHPFYISSLQAQTFEPQCSIEKHASCTSLFLVNPTHDQSGTKGRQFEIWKQGMLGLADQTIPLSTDSRVWPNISVDRLSVALKYQPPVLARQSQKLIAQLHESNEACERFKMGQELGVSLDCDIEEVMDWKAKLIVLLSQEVDEFIPIHLQYLTLFSLTHPRLLAGIPVEESSQWNSFLLDEAKNIEGLLEQLRDEVNFGTYVDTRARSATVPSLGISTELYEQLNTLVNSSINKYYEL